MGDKTFGQAEVNALLAKERKKHEHELAQVRAELTARTTELEAEQARAAELQTSAAKHEQARSEWQEKHVQLAARVRRQSLERGVGDALDKARVVPSARGIALEQMLRSAQVEQNDQDEVVSITLAGERFTDHAKAAKKFLDAHRFLALPELGGSGGSRSAFVGAGPPTIDITKQDPAALANAGWRQEPVR